MPDSGDISKKILVQLQLDAEKYKADLTVLGGALDKLKASQKELEKQGKKNSEEWVNNAIQIRQLGQEIRDTNKAIDNTTKALNAENGSIEQNRAAYSLASAQTIKYGEATLQTDAAIKQFVDDTKALNEKLKEQEKGYLGVASRGVGEYERGIDKSQAANSRAQEGFQTLTNSLQGLTRVTGFLPTAFGGAGQAINSVANIVARSSNTIGGFTGFKQFSTGAQEAEASAEGAAAGMTNAGEAAEGAAVAESAAASAATGLSAGLAVVIGVVVAVVAALGALKEYLGDIAGVSDTMSNKWAGMKAAFVSMANSIREGDWANLAGNMSRADHEAQQLNQDIITLNRNLLVSDAATAQENEHIATQMLKLRNIHTTAAEAEKIFSDVQETANRQYVRTYNLALDGYRTYARQIINAAGLTDAEYKKLMTGGVAYAEYLKTQNKHISDDLIANFQKEQIAMSNAQGIRDQMIQRAQNREEQKQAKDQARQQAAAQKAQEQESKVAEARQQAAELLQQSKAKELQAILDRYGAEVVAAQQHFDEEKNKLQKSLRDRLITAKEYHAVIIQLEKEKNASIQQITAKAIRQDGENLLRASEELRQLQVENIADETARQVAGLKQQTADKLKALDEQSTELQQQYAKSGQTLAYLQKSGTQQEVQEEVQLREGLLSQMDIIAQKKIAIAEKEQHDITEVTRNARNKDLNALDQSTVIEADKPGMDKEHLNAQINALKNQRDRELQNEKLTAAEKLLIQDQYQQKIDALANSKNIKRADEEVKLIKDVAGKGFSLLESNLQSQLSLRTETLNRQKTAELNNANLTSAQRSAIDQKYQDKERALKRQAFKEEQALNIAKAVMNGALAMLKTAANTGFPLTFVFEPIVAAQTALEVALIAAQKPGFAQGGQFKSDGRGALLPGYSRHDDTNATLRKGEAVVVSEAMQNPWARNLVSAVNTMFGGRDFSTSTGPKPYFTMPGFASGGVFTQPQSYLPVSNTYVNQQIPLAAAPQIDHDYLINGIARGVSNAVASMPAPIIDGNGVKGISSVQNKQARAQARMNH